MSFNKKKTKLVLPKATKNSVETPFQLLLVQGRSGINNDSIQFQTEYYNCRKVAQNKIVHCLFRVAFLNEKWISSFKP